MFGIPRSSDDADSAQHAVLGQEDQDCDPHARDLRRPLLVVAFIRQPIKTAPARIAGAACVDEKSLLAALAFRGLTAVLRFAFGAYAEDVELMRNRIEAVLFADLIA